MRDLSPPCTTMSLQKTLMVQKTLKTATNKNFSSVGRFLVNAEGRYVYENPFCPNCNSKNISLCGWYRCEDKLILELGLEVKQSHYTCNDCGCTFSTPFEEIQDFKRKLKKYLKEQSFELFNRGMSFGGIAEQLSKDFISISEETVRMYYYSICREYRNKKTLKASGYFYVDCQFLKKKGQNMCRLSVIDAIYKNCIVDIRIPAESVEEVVNELRLRLLPYKKKCFIVDGKIGLEEALKEEFGVDVQVCVYHTNARIIDDYVKTYGVNIGLLQTRNMYSLLTILTNHDAEVNFLNRKLNELENFKKQLGNTSEEFWKKSVAAHENKLLQEFRDFRRSLKRYRRKQDKYLIRRNMNEIKDKIKQAEILLTEKKEIKRLKIVKEKLDSFTVFLKDNQVPPTNCGVEHYYSKTLTKTDKKRFKSNDAMDKRLIACKARWNKWTSPTINLIDLFRQFARLARLFMLPT